MQKFKRALLGSLIGGSTVLAFFLLIAPPLGAIVSMEPIDFGYLSNKQRGEIARACLVVFGSIAIVAGGAIGYGTSRE